MATDADILRGRATDHTGRWQGKARALVRPGRTEEVAEVLKACRVAGVAVTVQGGRTSLVAGTVPEHDDVLLSTLDKPMLELISTYGGNVGFPHPLSQQA